MSNIFARSPYIVTVNEASQIGSKVELFIWNGTGSAPTDVTYTLSKLIPSSTSPATYYDISPYIREYLSFTTIQEPTSLTALNTSQWCNVRVKRYKLIGTTYTLLDTTDYYAFDGYVDYLDGANYNNGSYLLDEKVYYYAAGQYAGNLNLWMYYDIDFGFGAYAKYIKPDLTYTTLTAFDTGWKTIPRVHPSYTATGNTLELYDWTNTLLASYEFYPICEPKYTPVPVDFINKYGAWQREFFFKASKVNMTIESNEYNVMQSSSASYNTFIGQRKTFNSNAKKSIVLNTGFVTEDFIGNLQQLLMSEMVKVDGYPAVVKTKSLEMQKSINNHMINYTIEFDYAYNLINNVI